MEIDAATMRTALKFLRKLKLGLSYDPANLTSGHMSKGNEILILKSYVYSCVVAALFTITKLWKHPKSPLMDEWIKKM